MTKKSTNRGSGRRAVLRRLGIAFAILTTLSVLLYASTPFLVSQLAPRLARSFDLKTLELEIGYPGWRNIYIDRILVVSDAMEVHGRQARLNYNWGELLAGRIVALTFDELEIRLPSGASGDNDAAQPAGDTIVLPDTVQTLNIKKLTLTFPDTGFVGIGHAKLVNGLLSLDLDGVEPELASRFSIGAELSADGVYRAHLGQRDVAEAEILEVNGRIGPDTISIAGTVNLSGFPLQLASQLTGELISELNGDPFSLPPGTGVVSAELQTILPFPLPDKISWHHLVATVPAFSVDWQSISDDLDLTLHGITGSAQFNGGDVEASVSGVMSYHLGKREFSAVLPADYQLHYRNDTLSGAAGPQLTVKDTAGEATATVQDFSLSNQTAIYFDAKADIDARLNDLTATGQLSSTLDGDALSVDGNLNVQNNPPQSKGEPVPLTKGVGNVAARLETRLPSPLPQTLAWQELTASVPSFAVDWRSTNNDIVLTSLAGSAEIQQGAVTASVSGAARYRLSGHNINLRLPKNYRIDYRRNKINGGPGPRLGLKEDKTDVVAIVRAVSLETTAMPRLAIDARIDATIDSINSAGRLTADVNAVNADFDNASGRLDYSGVVDIANRQYDGNLDTTFSVRGDDLTATGKLNSDLLGQVPLTLIYNLDSGAGNLVAIHSLDFRQGIAASLIPGWQAAYDLDAGHIAAELRLNWQSAAKIAAHVSGQLTDVRAHYEEYVASGINGHLNLHASDSSNSEDWWLEQTVMHVDRVDVGIPVDNLVFGLAWSGDQVQIRDASATVLGGRALARQLDYTISTGSTAFEILLQEIDLATILALEGDDVTGSGKLSGGLPVIIENDIPWIEAGKLSAAAPGGFLRLSPTLNIPAGQQNLSFALTALQDFTYSELTTQLDYAETGDLALAVHLKGYNPAVEQGRPIHYNLNISENIPVLLESLRLQNTITEDIEKRIQK